MKDMNKLLLIEYGSLEGRSVPARSLFNTRVGRCLHDNLALNEFLY